MNDSTEILIIRLMDIESPHWCPLFELRLVLVNTLAIAAIYQCLDSRLEIPETQTFQLAPEERDGDTFASRAIEQLVRMERKHDTNRAYSRAMTPHIHREITISAQLPPGTDCYYRNSETIITTRQDVPINGHALGRIMAGGAFKLPAPPPKPAS